MNYTVQGQDYHLHYSIGRIEQIERVIKQAVTGVLVALADQNYPSVATLTTLFAYGLLSEKGEYAPIKTATEYAQQQLQESGYLAMMNAVIEQIQEDCGFLFR